MSDSYIDSDITSNSSESGNDSDNDNDTDNYNLNFNSKYKYNKEDQIYGIFNNSSSTYHNKNKNNNAKLLAQPMSFISSNNKIGSDNQKIQDENNIHKFNKKNKNINDAADMDVDEDDFDDEIDEDDDIDDDDDEEEVEDLDDDESNEDEVNSEINELSLKRVRFSGIDRNNKPIKKSNKRNNNIYLQVVISGLF